MIDLQGGLKLVTSKSMILPCHYTAEVERRHKHLFGALEASLKFFLHYC